MGTVLALLIIKLLRDVDFESMGTEIKLLLNPFILFLEFDKGRWKLNDEFFTLFVFNVFILSFGELN